MSGKEKELEKRQLKRIKALWDKQDDGREDKVIGSPGLLHLIMPKRFLNRGNRRHEGKEKEEWEGK